MRLTERNRILRRMVKLRQERTNFKKKSAVSLVLPGLCATVRIGSSSSSLGLRTVRTGTKADRTLVVGRTRSSDSLVSPSLRARG